MPPDRTHTPRPSLTGHRFGLLPRQTAIAALLGAVLWLVAALILRGLGPLGVYEGSARVLLYLAIIPGTIPVVLLLRRLAGLERDQTAIGMSVATAAAALLDGIALAWFPGLYGGEVALQAGAGATILWGAGVGLALGMVMNRARA
jgi:hypothetical protein